VHLDNDRVTVAWSERWGKNPSRVEIDNDPQALTGQARLLADFATAIRTGAPAETSGDDNLWSFAAVMAGVISAKEKRTIDVSELLTPSPLVGEGRGEGEARD
jgi:predicted dehydrogenase